MSFDRPTLDRFRTGDRATLTAVYRAHAPELAKKVARGFSFRSGDDVQRFHGYRAPHEQQDAVQEVFARAFSEKGRGAYDGLTPYGAYLHGILKNLVVDDFRRRRASLEVFSPAVGDDDTDNPDGFAGNVAAPGDAADVLLARRSLSEAMKGFAASLPEREKRFVALRFENGLPQEEVARRMKVGRSTVRTLEERVRRRAHDRLRDKGLLEERSGAPAGVRGFFARLLPAFVVFFVVAGGAHG